MYGVFLVSIIVYYTTCLAAGQSETNLALNKPTGQSSTYCSPGCGSSNAVDGKNTNYGESTCSHTEVNDASGIHWWYVDLGSVKRFDEIQIHNRADSIIIMARLDGATIIVSNSSSIGTGEVCATVSSPTAFMTFPCKKWSRYVILSKSASSPLNFCEVIVLQKEIITTTTATTSTTMPTSTTTARTTTTAIISSSPSKTTLPGVIEFVEMNLRACRGSFIDLPFYLWFYIIVSYLCVCNQC